jgi:Xaa-Pro dipeptidase
MMNNPKLQKIEQLINKENFDAIALIPSPSFIWLTGKDKHLMERPTTLIITPHQTPALVIAGFELGSMEQSAIPFTPFPFDDNPSNWEKAFRQAGEALGLKGKRIAVEPNHFRFLETDFLKRAIPDCEIVSGESLFKQLRLHKTDEEISCMRKAAIIAQSALDETLKIVKAGVTEKEIASELVIQLLKAGCDPNFPFSPIVASGPNSADPHASVSDRVLQSGDLLLFDWGARYEGYCSDITRTFGLGDVSERQREIYRTVEKANRAASEAARPGVTCGSIDKAARDVIQEAGYGKYFTHRVGHGLGLEAHEDPYMFAESQQILEPGMCFTDEPGIYVPGRGGIRIEDDIVITEDGCKNITDYPRELRIL